jgi:putative FmdB family regulatory protein
MPLYEYRCEKCREKVTLGLPLSQLGLDNYCVMCGTVLTRIFSVPHIRLRPEKFNEIQKTQKRFRDNVKE